VDIDDVVEKWWAGNGSGAALWAPTFEPGHSEVGPTWFGFFIGFPKLVQLVKSKHVPYFTPKIPNFFVKLDWNI
jgi:hypothetical protein